MQRRVRVGRAAKQTSRGLVKGGDVLHSARQLDKETEFERMLDVVSNHACAMSADARLKSTTRNCMNKARHRWQRLFAKAAALKCDSLMLQLHGKNGSKHSSCRTRRQSGRVHCSEVCSERVVAEPVGSLAAGDRLRACLHALARGHCHVPLHYASFRPSASSPRSARRLSDYCRRPWQALAT